MTSVDTSSTMNRANSDILQQPRTNTVRPLSTLSINGLLRVAAKGWTDTFRYNKMTYNGSKM